MDAALKAELLALFERVLFEVRRKVKYGISIYVCDILRDEQLDDWHRLDAPATDLWTVAGFKFGGDPEGCGWWEQTLEGHGQRMLALESIIAELGGTVP